jgi:hypothetical protein
LRYDDPVPRKLCPSCKTVNAASAPTCRCGHTFDLTAVRAAPAARRCPMCGIVSPASTAACQCGYDFEDAPERLHELLKDRLAFGRTITVLGAVVVLAGVALVLVSWLLTLLCTAPGLAMLRRGTRIASAARANLDELNAKAAALPVAKLVDR